ncbi:hypothetical protein CAEBREN_12757 [Caenorhabditis brenneri]|uniref:Uncharacterized protein n=1 Tax=Caenorhabditis brenneri TaxID=135651 RepID=G0NX42_CAEBE|nr:hypothetical protein CAEBREN_12757 [Caenorhabditis brenneri]
MVLLEEMEEILDNLEIDKNMITVVDDVDYTLGVRDLLKRGTGQK